MVAVVLVRHLMVDMVEEMDLVIQEQVEMVDQEVVEVVVKVVEEEQVVPLVQIHQVLEYILVPLDTMLSTAIMVEILVDLVNIKEDVEAAVELDSMVVAVLVDLMVVTALVAAVVEVQGSLVVLGQIQYLKMDRMELVEVEVLKILVIPIMFLDMVEAVNTDW